MAADVDLGIDLDTAVFDLVCAALERSAAPVAARLRRPRSADDQRQRLLVWQDARAARESLTRNASATVYVAAAGQDVLVTRAEYESAAEPLLRSTIEVTLATARESRVPADGFAGWFLVGGATRTPLVATLLLRATGRSATVLEEPQLVVAEGALHCGPAPAPVPAPGGGVAVTPPAPTPVPAADGGVAVTLPAPALDGGVAPPVSTPATAAAPGPGVGAGDRSVVAALGRSAAELTGSGSSPVPPRPPTSPARSPRSRTGCPPTGSSRRRSARRSPCSPTTGSAA
ncbi:Hsp70 family protein [Dactylosporangium sp. NPDC050688]|uniref:Hsp70 family protein n=1 Tax=Dactylosporangium sp. NPDC050688 TaxID=3157217 RepID=UPI00340B1EF0